MGERQDHSLTGSLPSSPLLLNRNSLSGLEELGPGSWAAHNLPSCHASAIPAGSLAVTGWINPCSSQMFWAMGCKRLMRYLFSESEENMEGNMLLVQSHKAEK